MALFGLSRGHTLGVLLAFVVYYTIFITLHKHDAHLPSNPKERLKIDGNKGRVVVSPGSDHEAAINAIQHLQQQSSDLKAAKPVSIAENKIAVIPTSPKVITVPTAAPIIPKQPTSVASKPANPLLEECREMEKRHHVVPDYSWGSLPKEKRRRWKEIDCDALIAEKGPMNGEQQPQAAKGGEDAGLMKVGDDKQQWCMQTKQKYGIEPMKSWGSLPPSMIPTWKGNNCDIVFTVRRMGSKRVSSCLSASEQQSKQIDANNPNLNSSLPLIAILAATTTRKMHHPSTKTMSLFVYLLPSLIRTLDCGYRYEYVLGYDKGDPFYDSEAGMAEVKEWFRVNVEEPLKSNAIQISLRAVRVNNTLKKPGPVFIEMARAAYRAGASYFYRVNDDTELLAPWPNIFVNALLSLGYPYGVVGPLCNQGNERILTHDFVHRTHMEIFDMNYYPPQLTDWWMDDWISFVYGQSRTFKASKAPVAHHTGAHGTRYEVDRSHESLLLDLVIDGHNLIRRQMLKRNVDEATLKKFDEAPFRPRFVHRDIPSEVYSKYATAA